MTKIKTLYIIFEEIIFIYKPSLINNFFWSMLIKFFLFHFIFYLRICNCFSSSSFIHILYSKRRATYAMRKFYEYAVFVAALHKVTYVSLFSSLAKFETCVLDACDVIRDKPIFLYLIIWKREDKALSLQSYYY
jgi:hypothetical protein